MYARVLNYTLPLTIHKIYYATKCVGDFVEKIASLFFVCRGKSAFADVYVRILYFSLFSVSSIANKIVLVCFLM